MRVGTRADLHKNGHKRFRNVFLTSVFEHGADEDKTRKVSSRFLPLSAKFSAQKRRIAFSGIYAGENVIKVMAGNLSSEFLVINASMPRDSLNLKRDPNDSGLWRYGNDL